VKEGASRFQNLHLNLTHTSRTVLYEIISVMLGYHKFCVR
jgi:hypothetical protein